MASTDGVRRIKTYGKHKSSVAVSRRDWWNTVSEGTASTSTTTLESDTYSQQAATSPSHRAAKKASNVIELNDDDEDEPVPKHVPLPRARKNKSINNRSRIVDLSNDDSDKDYEPSTSKLKSTTTSSSRNSMPSKTPANAVLKQSVNALDQQETRQRVVSLSSDTSEEDKIRIKPLKSKPVDAANSRATQVKKRIIIEDSPPVSPLPASIEHVDTLQDRPLETGHIATPPVPSSPLKPTMPMKLNVLGRKDSNLSRQANSASSSPSKKKSVSSTHTSPTKPLQSANKASSSVSASSIACFKENNPPLLKPMYTTQQAVTPAKAAVRAVPKAGSKPTLVSSRTSASSSSASSRTTSSSKSGSTSSASIALPPPRGHNSASTVAWRRPLAPISAARPKTKVSTLSSIARKVESSASPMPVARSAAMHVNYDSSSASARSSASRVVVEIPFGLPRSRSPAPGMKEPRRRQTSSQSAASSSSTSSNGCGHSPLAFVQQGLATSPSLGQSETSSPAATEPPARTLASVNAVHTTEYASGPQEAGAEQLPPSLRAEGAVPQKITTILEHCDGLSPDTGSSVLDFASFVDNPIPLCPDISQTSKAAQWSKLGEATFSEVFIVRSSTQGASSSDSRAGIVVKVIPLHMSTQQHPEEEIVEEAFAKNEGKKEEVFTTSVDDLAREIRIFRALSRQDTGSRKGWPGFKGAYLVRGKYPDALLSSWDAFKAGNPKKAENPRPDYFASNQVFALICMDHAGVDLESFKLTSWSEAASVLWQVSSSLSQAEQSLQFEHRDLHWGNILVERQVDQNMVAVNNCEDLPACLSSGPASVSATIIDFTLSRADVPQSGTSTASNGLQTLSGGFDDEWMFTGEGDYQYECYRIMKRLVQDKWEQYRPATNVVWLHYLVQKLLGDKGLKKPVQRAATRTVAIKASLPGTPLRNRTRRGAAAIKKPIKAVAQGDQSTEKEAYESLLLARSALREAIAQALKTLPKSTSLTDMMAGLHMSNIAQAIEGQSVRLNSAGDFVEWWRNL